MVVLLVDSDRFRFSRTKISLSIDVIHRACLFQSRCVLFASNFPFCSYLQYYLSVALYQSLVHRFHRRLRRSLFAIRIMLENRFLKQKPAANLISVFVVVFLSIIGPCSFSSLSRWFSICGGKLRQYCMHEFVHIVKGYVWE